MLGKKMKYSNLFVLITTLFFIASHAAFAQSVAPDSNNEDVNTDIKRQVQELYKTIKNQGPRFSVAGKVERGKSAPFSINGVDFSTNDKTRIYGDLKIGGNAKVRGVIKGGAKIARVVQASKGGNSNNGDIGEGDAEALE